MVSNLLHIKNGELSVPFLSEGQIKKETFENEKQFGAFNEKVVSELMDMGFPKAKVLEALTLTDGNKDQAATYLTENTSSLA